MKNDFDLDVLRSLENNDLPVARSNAINIIQTNMNGTKKSVVNRLIFDINKAKSSKEVCRIMWYTYLSGHGLGVIDSEWKKTYYGK
jgi:hypothetical protein